MSQTSILDTFRNGQKYMTEWPMQKELAALFPESRVIKTTQFAIKMMPAVAVMSILIQMALNNYAALPQAMVIALFALSLPLHGLWWLGKRRETHLPPALAGWYRELHEKLITEGNSVKPIKAQPRYKELAQTLQRAFKNLDKASLERWF